MPLSAKEAATSQAQWPHPSEEVKQVVQYYHAVSAFPTKSMRIKAIKAVLFNRLANANSKGSHKAFSRIQQDTKRTFAPTKAG